MKPVIPRNLKKSMSLCEALAKAAMAPAMFRNWKDTRKNQLAILVLKKGT
jgi:hypothetical protein